MRLLSVTLGLVLVLLVSACDAWPRNLEPLAESIAHRVAGHTTAWLVAGDVVVIDVAKSPSYRLPQSELEALATDIAGEAIERSAAPLESIAITFHEGEISDDPQKVREFIFLVIEHRPVLQPHIDLDATGPLTAAEIRAAMDRLDEVHDRLGKPLAGEYRQCVLAEVEKRARDAGDPETLDPASLEFVTAETWKKLDAFGKRLILTQAITSKALFVCAETRQAGERA